MATLLSTYSLPRFGNEDEQQRVYLSKVLGNAHDVLSQVTASSVTSVTASAPLVSSGGAAPNISIPKATVFVDGYLSSADWNTFNSKLSSNQPITLSGDATGSGATSITVTLANSGVGAGTYGDSTHIGSFTVDAKGRITSASSTAISFPSNSATATALQTGRTFSLTGDATGTSAAFNGTANASIPVTLVDFGASGASHKHGAVPDPGAVAGTTKFLREDATWAVPPSSGGTVTAVTGTAPVVSSGGTTPAISMAQATSSVDGYLSHVDWGTFNGKQNALGYTAAADSAVVHLAGTETITGQKTLKNAGADSASLGSELTTNGSFSGSATGWTLGTDWAYGTNNVILTLASSGMGTLSQNISVTSGVAYYISWTQQHSVANNGSIDVSIGTADTFIANQFGNTSANSAAITIVANATGSVSLAFTPTYAAAGTITISNVSVKAITPASAITILDDSAGNVVGELRASYKTPSYYNLSLGVNGLANTNISLSGTSGKHNLNLGYYGLFSNYSGRFNTNIGNLGLKNNSIGTNNTNIGYSGLLNNTTGGDNLNIGYSGLLQNITGSKNTSIGNTNLLTVVTSSQNIGIGYNVDIPADVSGSMSIGNIIYGFANTGTGSTVSTGRIAIGKNTDDGVNQLQVAGSIVGSNLSGTNTGDQSGALIKRTLLTSSSGTFTTQAGTHTIRVRGIGGGGGSGYITGNLGFPALGQGGGGGGSVADRIISVSPSTGYSYTCGAAGAGGTSGSKNGGSGGDSTFVVGATTITAKGGTGTTWQSTLGAMHSSTVAGGAGGAAAVNDDFGATGDAGGYGFAFGFTDGGSNTEQLAIGGVGGASIFGVRATQNTAAGSTQYGGGGGGSTCTGSPDSPGKNGCAGCWIVEEYS